MAQDKHQSEEHYMEEELAESQQDTQYAEDYDLPDEQYNSPESMKKHRNTHVGNKTRTLGYKG